MSDEAPVPATQDAPSTSFISPRNSAIMLRYLEGQSIGDIAVRFRLPEAKVRAVLQLKAVRQEIQRLGGLTRDEWIKDRISGLAIEALDTIRDTMRGENTSELRFKAATKVLDATPVLREATKNAGIGHDIGTGLGEAIINRLAELEGQERARREAIDVTPAEEEHGS